ncbi:MAG: hypothetical protein SFV19_06860 [Rhodospirillaceae bacterium]|nr:hypothetical protein [Rhodospirillaceae bacterium]
MGNNSGQSGGFGLPEIVAAALAAGLAAFAAPSPAASTEVDVVAQDHDWDLLWSGVVPPASLTSPTVDALSLAISHQGSLLNLPHGSGAAENQAAHTAPTVPADHANDQSHETMAVPVPVRTAPAVDGAANEVALRADHWPIASVDGVVRLAAYARGPLAYEDMTLLRSAAATPRRVGTGVGFVTDAPIYVGAAIASDAPIYDFDFNRFRGTRWSTSVFLGAKTSLGPVYLGTTKEADGTRSAYLYLGKWF